MNRYFSLIVFVLLLSCQERDCAEPPTDSFAFVNANGGNLINEGNRDSLTIWRPAGSGRDSVRVAVATRKDDQYNYVFDMSPLVSFPGSNPPIVYKINLANRSLGYFTLSTAYIKTGDCPGYSYLSNVQSNLNPTRLPDRPYTYVFRLSP